MSPVSRRGILIGGAAVGAVAVLSACDTSTVPAGPTTPTPTPNPTPTEIPTQSTTPPLRDVTSLVTGNEFDSQVVADQFSGPTEGGRQYVREDAGVDPNGVVVLRNFSGIGTRSITTADDGTYSTRMRLGFQSGRGESSGSVDISAGSQMWRIYVNGNQVHGTLLDFRQPEGQRELYDGTLLNLRADSNNRVPAVDYQVRITGTGIEGSVSAGGSSNAFSIPRGIAGDAFSTEFVTKGDETRFEVASFGTNGGIRQNFRRGPEFKPGS